MALQLVAANCAVSYVDIILYVMAVVSFAVLVWLVVPIGIRAWRKEP